MLLSRRLRLTLAACLLLAIAAGGPVACKPAAPTAVEPGEAADTTASPAEVEAAMRKAERLLAADDVDGAYTLLLPLSTTVRDNPAFRELYQRTVEAKWVLDARKAHQQHAKEQTGGALAPEDVFR